jgi:uncharacterized SAM-binding protein YcdF (DUF218 family)
MRDIEPMGRNLRSFALLAVVLGYAFGVWLFLLRPQDALPERADAVFVLAGGRSRLPVAQGLIATGAARTLVVSEAGAGDDPGRRRLCAGPRPKRYTLVCARAEPYSTRGEARLLARLVQERKWSSVIVVSSHYHLFRARLLLRRCTGALLTMRAAEGDAWWRKALAVPLEYAKLARAELWQRGC